MSDPTKVRNQPELTTSSGTTWLVIGALMTVITGAIFAFALAFGLHPTAAALTGIVAVIVLYAGMVIAWFTTDPGPVRLRMLAILLIALAVIAFVCVGIVAATEWNVAS